MRQFIEKLSDRTEFVVVTTICFSYFVVGSLLVLLSGTRTVDLTTGRVLQGIFIELAILGVFAALLRIRGWRLERLGLRFSWKAAAAGIPLFIIYLLLYWITATLVLLVYPAARTVWIVDFRTSAPFFLVLVFIIINSFFEEVTVTAYVVESLSREGAGVAIAASALIRFAYHLYQGPISSISVLPLGLLFATMFWRWRNVWPLVTAHTIANIIAFALSGRA